MLGPPLSSSVKVLHRDWEGGKLGGYCGERGGQGGASHAPP